MRLELDLMKSEKLDQKHIEHTFDTPTFLGPESTGDLFLKINKVTFDLEIVVTERPPHQYRDSLSWFFAKFLPKKNRTSSPANSNSLDTLASDLTCRPQAATVAKSPLHSLTPF